MSLLTMMRPPEFKPQGPGPVVRDPKQDELASGQLAKLLKSDSPLMTAAQTRANQAMNGRGLLNSSMTAGATTSAMVDAAAPIAQADAHTHFAQAQTNQNAQNQFNLTDKSAGNQAQLTGLQASFQADRDKQQQDFTAGQQALDRRQQSDLQQRQQHFQAGQSERDRQHQATLQGSQQQFQAGQSERDRQHQGTLQSHQQQFQAGESTKEHQLRQLMQDQQLGFTAQNHAADRQASLRQFEATQSLARDQLSTAQFNTFTSMYMGILDAEDTVETKTEKLAHLHALYLGQGVQPSPGTSQALTSALPAMGQRRS